MSRACRLCAMQLLIVLAFASAAEAQGDFSSDLSDLEFEVGEIGQRLSYLHSTFVVPQFSESSYTLDSRLAEGRMLYFVGDYVLAAIAFLDIVENTGQPGTPRYSDARYYLADSLYLARNFIAARIYFRDILDDPSDDFRQDAARRLLEIAFATHDMDDIEELYAALRTSGDLTRSDVRYVLGKALYFQGNYRSAAQEFARIGQADEEYSRARYFIGISHVQHDEWDQALNAFTESLTAGELSAPLDGGALIDLSHLAMGRIYYELGQTDEALDAYQSVSRHSPQFDRALYEMTWTYMAQERYREALHTLEILVLAVPDSRYQANAQLLRGDMHLRLAEYTQAQDIFDETVSDFSPLRDELAAVISRDANPDDYFEALIDYESAELVLPALAREWVEDDEAMSRALELVSDLGVQASEVEESREIIAEIEAVLSSSSRVDLVPELREAYGNGLEINNRLMRIMGVLTDLEAALVISRANDLEQQEYSRLLAQRRQIESAMSDLPATYDQIVQQEQAVESEIEAMEMEVYRLGYEIETQRAQMTALRYQVGDDEANGIRTPQEASMLRAELDNFDRGLDELEDVRNEMRRALEHQRLSTGLGSVAGADQNDLRFQYDDALRREQSFLRQSRNGSQSGELADLDRVRRSTETVIGSSDRLFHDISQIIDSRAVEVDRQLNVERSLLDRYDGLIREFGSRGERLAGEVAFENFIDVQDQFYELILRADVGIIDVAWRQKEDRTIRLDELFDERNQQLRVLDAEFREVLED